jgi:enoyl-CoA hydratase
MADPDDSPLRVERSPDGVARVVLTRPEKLNAMTRAFFELLPVTLADLAADDEVRAVVITGSGRAFSAGGDVATFPDLVDPERARPHTGAALAAFRSVEACPLPVIAAVNGLAHGGGLELALACDHVVAAERATFALPEARLGIAAAYALARAPQRIGRSWTWRLAATATPIDAATALRIGLVDEVVADGEVVAAAHAIAAAAAALPPGGLAVVKRYLGREAGGDLSAEVDLTVALLASAEAQAAIEAFLRRPRH